MIYEWQHKYVTGLRSCAMARLLKLVQLQTFLLILNIVIPATCWQQCQEKIGKAVPNQKNQRRVAGSRV